MSANDEFRDTVKNFIELHDELAESARAMSALRKRKEQLSQKIIEFMRSNEIDECALADGKLIRKTTKKVETLKKEHILDALKKRLGDEVAAERPLVDIYAARAVESSDSLRRTKKRGAAAADE
jgi:ribosomal protein L20A (L18A)